MCPLLVENLTGSSSCSSGLVVLDFSLCVVINDDVGERTSVVSGEASLNVTCIKRILADNYNVNLNVHYDLLLEYFPRVLL